MLSCFLALFPASVPIWQIGAVDGTGAEFALAPNGYSLYRNDPAYIVGLSAPASWPYVLPGPDDGWASGRPHRATVYFGLQGPATPCRFVCDFVETHHNQPPKLALWVNGSQIARWQPPRGNGDDAIEGHPEKGRHSSWSVDVPARALRNGNNELEVRSESGSWAVFDALRLDGPDSLKTVPIMPELRIESITQDQVVLRTAKGPRQLLRLNVTNLGPTGQMDVQMGTDGKWSQRVEPGSQTIKLLVPPVAKTTSTRLKLSLGNRDVSRMINIRPVRPWTIYLLPHSHVDIGYTDDQPVVQKMHRRNLFDAMTIAKESASFPADSRYRFNGEATWILDNLLQDSTPDELRRVSDAFQRGEMDSSAGYCNTLTAVMRPEELMRSYGYAATVRDRLGIDLRTATQTDVPGVTWGAVAGLSQAGVKSLVLMPNIADRIGGVLRSWQDKPFYWVSPSGQEKILVWETTSYGTAHALRHFNGDRTKIFRTSDPTKGFLDQSVLDRLAELDAAKYPYDMIAFPWSGTDNYPVDADVPYAVRHWNDTYVTPHVVSSTVTHACDALVRRYGKSIPVVRGDFTPYWEDGVGSSAHETAMNRASADRLVQAETLSAMSRPLAYDQASFWRAWSNAILYSEHTWGAYNSVSAPDAASVKRQWAFKRNYAVQADKRSRSLFAQFASASKGGFFGVTNTNSWPRTDLVTLPRARSSAGDRVLDEIGNRVPSQRLRSGELAFLAKGIPAFGTRNYRVVPGKPFVQQRVNAGSWKLASADWQVQIDPKTGAVNRLWNNRLERQFADASTRGINEYLYLPGSDLKGLKAPTAPRFEVIEPGPLVARVRITSSAAGARKLVQEVQVVAGLDRVDFRNDIDKIAIREKEGVHFAFPFAVPGGQVRIHSPWAVVRPDLDQIAGSNKNWFNTQYFADVSNSRCGVTWSSLDAPLMEVGGITANLMGGAYDAKDWLQRVGPTQTIYSWALNNHWYTNYRADQSGLLTFRYSLRAHGSYEPTDAYRFGAGLAQPLVLTSARRSAPLLVVSGPGVVVTSLKPSADHKALIVRLWCVGDKATKAVLKWRLGLIKGQSLTDSGEHPGRSLRGAIAIAGWQVQTVRAELR